MQVRAFPTASLRDETSEGKTAGKQLENMFRFGLASRYAVPGRATMKRCGTFPGYASLPVPGFLLRMCLTYAAEMHHQRRSFVQVLSWWPA